VGARRGDFKAVRIDGRSAPFDVQFRAMIDREPFALRHSVAFDLQPFAESKILRPVMPIRTELPGAVQDLAGLED
jgi:hypothetical protein